MLASLTMLFTTSAKPGCEQQQSWLTMAVTGHQYKATCQAEGEGESNPMNGQLFMSREQNMKAGGEDALPQWTSVILTSFIAVL